MATEFNQPEPAPHQDHVVAAGTSRGSMFSAANVVALKFFYHIVALTVGFIVIIGAAVALALLASYANGGGPILRPIAWIARVASYGLLIVGIIWFSSLTLAESWHFFRGRQGA